MNLTLSQNKKVGRIVDRMEDRLCIKNILKGLSNGYITIENFVVTHAYTHAAKK